jgi:hypothetical protein
VEEAEGKYFIHFLPTRGIERNPLWIQKILNPVRLVDMCGMAGPVRPCAYHVVTGDVSGLPKKQIHMQQAIFAARTEVLRKVPWGHNFPHVYSDVDHSIKLIRARYELINVPEISSVADGSASNPRALFEAGPHI